MAQPQPLQIIETGDSDTDFFVLNEDNLKSIIDKIPGNTKVAIISVVGAFRTGKSFLLNFFLRYLRNPQNRDNLTASWMTSDGDEFIEGNMNGWNMVEESNILMSFAWRGGQERQTTGIWMWSQPFIRKSTKDNEEDLAILVMDTQGMFDNETTMTLTAQIFGLSTLVSSYQIYNVDKRIQEDNLQHLALFSEYGRIALAPQNEQKEFLSKTIDDVKVTTLSSTSNPEVQTESSSSSNQSLSSAAPVKETSLPVVKKPFQRLQFLLRDWQNFDTEWSEQHQVSAVNHHFLQPCDMELQANEEIYSQLRSEMSTYLNKVLGERGLADLQSTREQITRCFQTLDCFMLPHPGFEVIKKNFDGSVHKIDPFFRAMLNKYVRYIFDNELEAKVINHRQITGQELLTYFQVYVKMFQDGNRSFPQAMTMLDATAAASNRNAFDISLVMYRKDMDALAGPESSYVNPFVLSSKQDESYNKCLKNFDEMATMGSEKTIEKMRKNLIETMETERERYYTTNNLRNPFRDAELYVIPLVVASISFFMAIIVDKTCSTDFCEATEDTFVNIYLFFLFAIIVAGWSHIKGLYTYILDLYTIMKNQQSIK